MGKKFLSNREKQIQFSEQIVFYSIISLIVMIILINIFQ